MASEEPMNPTSPLINPEPTEREFLVDKSPVKEKSINKPTPFTGDRKTVEIFLLECQVYLQTNRRIYTTDEDRIAFILSYMNEKEALRWKQTYLRSLINDDGEIIYPTTKDFIKLLMHYFKPADQARDATHQLNLLKQGKKSAEEIITEFRLLVSQAGYSAETPTDHLHLIEKLQRVLNTSLVKKIMLSDNPPTTIDGWVEKAITIDSTYRITMEVLGQKINEDKTRNDKKTDKPGWTNYFHPRKLKEERDPNAMDVDAMSTEKRAVLMKKGACFICEEPGHIARDHKEHEKKKKENIRRTTSAPSKKKGVTEIHALLQTLSAEETKELLALQSTGQEKEEEKAQEEDDEDF
jgi:hypothetical protein